MAEFLTRIKNPDDKVRASAWESADAFGASAVKPLAELLSDSDMEIARAAGRGLRRIVRYAGRPGAEKERRAVAKELVGLLNTQPTIVRREALWMLSEIGDNNAVKWIAPLLGQVETREDARAALERIPGGDSLAALKSALTSVPDDFKPAIAQSLRARHVSTPGFPTQKLVPTRPVTGDVQKNG